MPETSLPARLRAVALSTIALPVLAACLATPPSVRPASASPDARRPDASATAASRPPPSGSLTIAAVHEDLSVPAVGPLSNANGGVMPPSWFIFDALYRLVQPDLLPVPNLVREPCAISGDGLTIKCQLVEATFHDGQPLTAEDVAYTYELALAGSCGPCVGDAIASVQATGRSVVFRLKRIDPRVVSVDFTSVASSRRHSSSVTSRPSPRLPSVSDPKTSNGSPRR
jgi:ABC-type transport system substrate-binding protein